MTEQEKEISVLISENGVEVTRQLLRERMNHTGRYVATENNEKQYRQHLTLYELFNKLYPMETLYDINKDIAKAWDHYFANQTRNVAASVPTILEEAGTAVHGDRARDYGTVTENFGRIAALWSTVLGVPVTPAQVGHCMILLKVARDMNSPKRDNLVDIAGYAATLEKLNNGE